MYDPNADTYAGRHDPTDDAEFGVFRASDHLTKGWNSGRTGTCPRLRENTCSTPRAEDGSYQ
jgi:hypothetical protein